MSSSRLGSRTVSLDEVIGNDRPPSLLITRQPRSTVYGTGITNSLNTLIQVMTRTADSFNDNMDQLFSKDATGKKQKPADETKTEKNKRLMRNKFDAMRDNLTSAVENGIHRSLAEMNSMTPEQQRELIGFWQQIKTFIGEFLAWFDRMMDIIFTKLLQGYYLNKQVVSGIFKKAIDELDSVLDHATSSSQRHVAPSATHH